MRLAFGRHDCGSIAVLGGVNWQQDCGRRRAKVYVTVFILVTPGVTRQHPVDCRP